MKFNELVNYLLNEGGFNAPIGNKRPSKTSNSSNYGTVNPYLSNKLNPSSYGGFKGDRLNGGMSTTVFPLPKGKKKKRKKHRNKKSPVSR